MKQTCILINPPILREERYNSKFLGVAGASLVPLGILYIASYLEKNGYNIEFLDAEQQLFSIEDTLKYVKNIIDKNEICYIGLTSTSVAFNNTVALAEKIKQNFPNIKIFLGGIHVTALPEHAMSYECFDYGIIGEGEVTVYELLETIKGNGDINSVNGIVYKKNGDLIFTNKRELIEDISNLPFPARHLLKDIEKYIPGVSDYKTLPVTNIMTSRGCPGQCTFCSNAVFGRTYRYRSSENIFKEIKEVIEKYKMREIHFIDDTFLANKKRIYDLFDLCNQNNLKFIWSCYSRIDNVTYDYLKFLKENGCWRISFGIESGDMRVLKDIKKHITLDSAEQVISWCKELGIKTTGLFMLGHPTDTTESINNTINFALKIPFSDAACCISTPLPGCEQFKTMFSSENNYRELDFSRFNTMYSIVTPKGMTNHDILLKQKEFYRKFYLRPHIIFSYIISLFSFAFFRKFTTLFLNAIYLILPTKKQ